MKLHSAGKKPRIIAITGTRQGVTKAQIQRAKVLIGTTDIKQLHHGDCTGADEQILWEIFKWHQSMSAEPFPTEVHAWPMLNLHGEEFRARTYETPGFIEQVMVHTPHPPLERNKLMVDAADMLWAFPGAKGSRGTWFTIEYATGRMPVIICFPDGTFESRPHQISIATKKAKK